MLSFASAVAVICGLSFPIYSLVVSPVDNRVQIQKLVCDGGKLNATTKRTLVDKLDNKSTFRLFAQNDKYLIFEKSKEWNIDIANFQKTRIEVKLTVIRKDTLDECSSTEFTNVANYEWINENAFSYYDLNKNNASILCSIDSKGKLTFKPVPTDGLDRNLSNLSEIEAFLKSHHVNPSGPHAPLYFDQQMFSAYIGSCVVTKSGAFFGVTGAARKVGDYRVAIYSLAEEGWKLTFETESFADRLLLTDDKFCFWSSSKLNNLFDIYSISGQKLVSVPALAVAFD